MSNWRGILKIVEVEHISGGKVVWRDGNINNLLHYEGERFILEAAFANDGSVVPANYYFGLDNRTTIEVEDTMTTIANEGYEPSTNGYTRVAVSSNGGFTVEPNEVNIYQAIGSIVTFSATGTGYGPIKNLFLTTQSNNSGYLLSTAVLSSSVTMSAGDQINLRMTIQLQDYSTT
jgi:hypothetical protein